MSIPSSAALARLSASCRRKTPPAITSRWCSACRSRSCSTGAEGLPLCWPGHERRAHRQGALMARCRTAEMQSPRIRTRAGRRRARSPAAAIPGPSSAVISIATFMVVLDTSIANVALAHIAGSLSASYDEATWVRHQLPGRQCRDHPDQRLAGRCGRAQALLHVLGGAVHACRRCCADLAPTSAVSDRCAHPAGHWRRRPGAGRAIHDGRHFSARQARRRLRGLWHGGDRRARSWGRRWAAGSPTIIPGTGCS